MIDRRAWLVAVMTAWMWGCHRRPDEGSPGGAVSALPTGTADRKPAGTGEEALLDGLRVGDVVEGYEVVWIGAARADGGMEVRLEAGGRRMRLVVALVSETPRPPVRTEKYGLFYEASDALHAARVEESLRVLEALANRIRKVEGRVPVPAGMGQLAAPSTTM
jgi:hypothetical protein